MFYYVSAQGKQAIRLSVARQLLNHVNRVRRRDPAAKISLTLLGHSAGSVIAFDLLFYLFFKNPGNKHVFIDENIVNIPAATAKGIRELRNMARSGRLRIRRLITFGSPITPFACRNDTVVQILADDGQLDPADNGLTANPEGFDTLKGPRWINLWDKDDPIAWPVEPLMLPDANVVKDIVVDVSDFTSKAHDAYWESKKVHKIIADTW